MYELPWDRAGETHEDHVGAPAIFQYKNII